MTNDTTKKISSDYLVERELRRRNPVLFQRFRSAVFVLWRMLEGYQQFFPNFTDHTELHSLNVIGFCNRIIGQENIEKLNEDEIYCLLMGCYLHDVGMGIRKEDYPHFLKEIGIEEDSVNTTEKGKADTIRKQHHEFSGRFIFKYAMLFDFPSEEHTYAVAEIARGHRKTDLYDPKDFPAPLSLENGNTICLPYLSALIRLADEIDVAADRNSALLYKLEDYTEECDIRAFSAHEAIRTVKILPEEFVLLVHSEEQWIIDIVEDLARRMQETLDYCREVTERRSPFVISQKKVRMERI